MRRRLLDALMLAALLAVLGMLGWLSLRFDRAVDLSALQRNSASPQTRALLQQLDRPLRITAWLGDPALEAAVARALERYRRVVPDRLKLEFANPDLEPERARAEGVRKAGVLILHYSERSERLTRLDEAAFAQALQRLLRQGETWAVMLQGHGEPALDDSGPQGLSTLHGELEHSGILLRQIDLARIGDLPDNARTLVLFGGVRDFLPGEVALIRRWIGQGRNLLWLQDPGPLHGLEPVAEALPLELPTGSVVDASQQVRTLIGIDNPLVIPAFDRADHPVTRALEGPVLLPLARAVQPADDTGAWQATVLLRSLPRSWVEQGPLDGSVGFDLDQGDLLGPVPLAAALQREQDKRRQRVAVVGDTQFLRNAWIARGANREFALALANWVLADDRLIGLQPRPAPDSRLDLGRNQAIGIAVVFLILLPGLLAGIGGYRWWRRRRG